MDSLSILMQTQIDRANISAINNERVLPEKQNIKSNLPLDHSGSGTRTYSDERGFGNPWNNPKTKLTRNMWDSASACDFSENMDFTPYMMTGDNDNPYWASIRTGTAPFIINPNFNLNIRFPTND